MIYEKDIRKLRNMDELTPDSTFYLKDVDGVFRKCDVPLTPTVSWMVLTKKYFEQGLLYLNTKNPGRPVLYNSL